MQFKAGEEEEDAGTFMDISTCCIPLARIQKHNSQSRARGLPDAAQEGMMLSRELLRPPHQTPSPSPGPLHNSSKFC